LKGKLHLISCHSGPRRKAEV